MDTRGNRDGGLSLRGSRAAFARANASSVPSTAHSRALVATPLIAVFLVCRSFASSADTGRAADLFGGGMGVQAGYASVETSHGTHTGVVYGIGGRLHFYIGDHLRVGAGGAAIKLTYASQVGNDSHVDIGYGGAIVEAFWTIRRVRLSVGALAGGGVVEQFHVVSEGAADTVQVVHTEDGSFVAAPMLTVEYLLTESISLMGVLDWLLGSAIGDRHQLAGPKAHLGVLFRR